MNNDLLKLSLNQGKQFKNYQKKIKQHNRATSKKVKEGFENQQETIIRPPEDGYVPVLQNESDRNQKINNKNQQDLNELTQLQAQYQNLLQQYNSMEKTIDSSSLATINRMDSSNPYLGKNVCLNDGNGSCGYVTNEGVFKLYSSDNSGTVGKNGCPNNAYQNIYGDGNVNVLGSKISSSPELVVGSNMVSGQSCGNAGKNVYASRLIDNASSSYIGCYNDFPAPSLVSIIPTMGSSGEVNGFYAYASSTYYNDNYYSAWAAFDNNVFSMWHSSADTSDSPQHAYDTQTGVYTGSSFYPVNMINGSQQNILGEFLQINLPNLQPVVATQYSIVPRQDMYSIRSPNSWYICGWKDNQWYEVDRQTGQNFNSGDLKQYTVSNPAGYGAYVIIIDKVGNDETTTDRRCVQIAEFQLYTSSEYTYNDSQRAMIWNPSSIGYTTLDKCQTYASDNGYQYFSMQDYQTNGTAACLVSNNYDKIMAYGDATQKLIAKPIWSSNTSGTGSNTCSVTSDGRITITNIESGEVIWQSPNPPGDCVKGGLLNIDSITATYGANCNASGYNVATGNATDKVKEYARNASDLSNFIFPVNNGTLGDPAGGCGKGWDTAYQCGTEWKTSHIDYAEGQNFMYDCTQDAKNCVFCMYLQPDGNYCLYRGADPWNISGYGIWCAMTNGQQKERNPDWVALKGKYGRDYMKMNEALGPGEWLGSDDGSLKLVMEKSGNLVLYISEMQYGW